MSPMGGTTPKNPKLWRFHSSIGFFGFFTKMSRVHYYITLNLEYIKNPKNPKHVSHGRIIFFGLLVRFMSLIPFKKLS